MPTDMFEARRKSLEAAFFAKQNETLRAKLKKEFERERTRESLKESTGITNEAVLDVLLSLQVNLESLAAFALYPLIEVAWADGSVDDRERGALLRAARQHGIAPGSVADALLEEWLLHPPGPDGRTAWYAYVGELNTKLTPAERGTVREELLRRMRAVAEASGGFLGLGSRTSAKEDAVLDAVADAFPD